MISEKRVPKLDAAYDAVVVGAGNGGLAAALHLAVKGAKPLVLEQHNLPGGFATSFVRGRFEFEASLHELSSVGSAVDKGSIRQFLEDEAKVAIDWVSVPEAYRLILTEDNINIRIPFGTDAFIAAIDKEVPGSAAPLRKYLDLCNDLNDVINVFGKLAGKFDLTRIANLLSEAPSGPKEIKDALTKAGNFLRTLPYSVDEVTRTFNIPDRAVKILYPYWCYLGIPMNRMSFPLWAVMLVHYMNYGAYIPKCRSHEMTSAMEARIRELGGNVEYNTRVEKILVKNGRVTGVETSAGDMIETSCVISNASPTLTYNRLIHPREEVPETAYRYVNARKHAAAGFVVYLGLDASVDELGLDDYGYFISPHMCTEEIYDSTKKLGVPKMQATICLNRTIPDCSPEGTTILSMTTMFTPDVWTGVAREDYFKVKNGIADGMIDDFEKATGAKIREHIEEIEVATPVTFARYTRTYKGIIYGYEPDPWDSIIPRVLAEKEEKYIGGLEFAGGFSTMCHGYSSALFSGRAAAQAALRKIGKKS